ncbi:MAG: hypothetical protein AAF740_13630 [Bacteroidota bacterium]
MKNSWKILFTFWLLLPLAACEEDCGGGVGGPADDSPSVAPISFWYIDPINKEPIEIDTEVIVYAEGRGDSLFVINSFSGGAVYTNDGGLFPAGTYAYTVGIYSNAHMFRDVYYYYLEFGLGGDIDTLRVENARFNQGDCDENNQFDFYYNDRFVFSSDKYWDIFPVEKEL